MITTFKFNIKLDMTFKTFCLTFNLSDVSCLGGRSMGKIALKEQITLNFIGLIISKYLDHTSGWKYSWDSQTPIIFDFLSDHFSTVVDASFPVSCRSKAAKIIHP